MLRAMNSWTADERGFALRGGLIVRHWRKSRRQYDGQRVPMRLRHDRFYAKVLRHHGSYEALTPESPCATCSLPPYRSRSLRRQSSRSRPFRSSSAPNCSAIRANCGPGQPGRQVARLDCAARRRAQYLGGSSRRTRRRQAAHRREPNGRSVSYFWSPDSKTILFLNDNGGDENFLLYGVDVATGTQKTLTPFEKTRVAGRRHQPRGQGPHPRRPEQPRSRAGTMSTASTSRPGS